MTTLKLTYFDIHGLAEVPRLLLHYGEVAFEDNRLADFDAFKKVKDTFLFQQVPVLEVDGAVLAQSGAIMRYAARRVDVYPQDAWELGQVEMSLGAFKDLSPALIDIKYKTTDEAEKVTKTTKFITETVPLYLGPVEAYAQEGRFIHGDTLTLADFVAFNLFENVLSGFEEFDISKFPKLAAVAEKVRNLPTLQAYLKKE